MLKARALSIRQPWAWLIVRPDIATPMERMHAMRRHLMKTVENRTWPTNFRGGFLVHAAKVLKAQDCGDAFAFADRATGGGYLSTGSAQLVAAALERGGIVGYAEVIDCMCTERHEALPPAQRSPWFMGEYGFRLANVHPLPFMPITGRLGFFEVEVPDDYIPAHLRARLAA